MEISNNTTIDELMSDLHNYNLKLKKSTDSICALKEKLQYVYENSKVWKGMESKFSSTKVLLDHVEKSLQMLASLVRDAEQDKKMFEDRLSKSGDVFQRLQLQVSGLEKNLETAEENFKTSEVSELRDSVEEREQLHLQFKDRESLLENQNTEIQSSLSVAYNALREAKKQYDLMMESKQLELSMLLKEISAINDTRRKSELEKLEVLEKEKAEKLVREMETKCVQNLTESKEESKCNLIIKIGPVDNKNEPRPARVEADDVVVEKTMLLIEEHEGQIREMHELGNELHKLQEQLEFQTAKFSDLPSDILHEIVKKCMQVDPRRVIGDFFIINRSIREQAISEDFEETFRKPEFSRGWKYIVFQGISPFGHERQVWSLVSDPDNDWVFSLIRTVPVAKTMVGVQRVYAAFGDNQPAPLEMLDLVSMELNSVGTPILSSKLLVYGYHNRVLRVFDVEEQLYFQLATVTALGENVAWSTPEILSDKKGVLRSACAVESFFGIIFTEEGVQHLIRVGTLTGEVTEDAMPTFCEKSVTHLFERRNNLCICNIGRDGYRFLEFEDATRRWGAENHLRTTILQDLSVYFVYGVGGDCIVLTLHNFVRVINTVQLRVISSMFCPVVSGSDLIAGYMEGCLCSRGSPCCYHQIHGEPRVFLRKGSLP